MKINSLKNILVLGCISAHMVIWSCDFTEQGIYKISNILVKWCLPKVMCRMVSGCGAV